MMERASLEGVGKSGAEWWGYVQSMGGWMEKRVRLDEPV
jgi:hypothetical protein